MKKNQKRHALLMSALSLLLCVSMLVGTTFAWFTDEVTSGMNTIAAGNLDIELLADGVKVESGTKLFSEVEKWEPGVVVYENLQVVNAGSLALKYQMSLNFGKENTLNGHKLSEVLQIAVVDKIAQGADRAAVLASVQNATSLEDFSIAGSLTAGAKTEEKAVVIFWAPGENDNWYNANNGQLTSDEKPLSIEFGVKLLATQLMSEDDSFGTDYDKDAWVNGFDVFTAQDLQAAINNGETAIDLMANIETAESIVIPEGATVALNLNGKTLTGTGLDAEGNKVHTIVNNGTLSIAGGTVKSTGTNGGSAISNNGVLTMEKVTADGAPSDTAAGTASYAVNTQGANSKLTVINCNITGRGAIGATKGTKVEINGGKYHTPAVAWGHAVYANGEGTEVVINDGTFSEGYEMAADNWGMYQIYSGNKAKVTVNGGSFQPWDCANGYDLCTGNEGTIEIYGGTFAENPSSQGGKNYVAADCLVIDNKNGTWSVYAKGSTMTLANGATLDLGGVEFDGTVVAEGDLTIKGDTKIKTLKATSGGKITVEEGKTLTLKNFSFGAKENNTAEYVITGGTVNANYGFFQHGKYTLEADFETGYMYYSYGSDITVKGNFHSQGKGDGLDYVRGKLTIAEGGKSIHDKSLWVGQPASWGAMEATLIVEKGGYVQANSLSIYEGSAMYNSAANIGVDGVGVKYNKISGEIRTTAASQEEMNDAINNAQSGATIMLGDGEYSLPTLANKEGITIIGAADGSTVIGGENASTGFGGNFGKGNTYKNLTFTGTSNGVRWSYGKGGTVIFDNCTFAGDSTYGFHIDQSNGATFIFNNCTFSGFNAFAGDLVKVTFNNCTFLHNGNYGHTNIWSVGEFNNCTWGEGVTYAGDEIYIDGVAVN